MLSLCAAALSAWPNPAHDEPPGDAAIREEYERLTIYPTGARAADPPRQLATHSVVALAAFPERPSIEVTARLLPGEPVGPMLRRAGVAPVDAANIAELVAQALPRASIEPGWPSKLILGARSRPGAPRSFTSAALRIGLRDSLQITRHGAAFVINHRPISALATDLRIQGAIGTSLSASLLAAGLPSRIVDQYFQAIAAGRSRTRVTPVQGDRFDLILSIESASDGQREIGDVLFASLDRAGRPQAQSMRWGSAGVFVPTLGAPDVATEASLAWPLDGRLVSRYGFRRHPLLGIFRLHAGVDIAARSGTPIYAPASGMVVQAGRHGGYGNYIRLTHGPSLATAFGHLSRIAVVPGEAIQRGQLLGWVGSTGLATGPHLHFEVLRNGHSVDPLASASRVFGERMKTSERAQFASRLAAYRSLASVPRLSRID